MSVVRGGEWQWEKVKVKSSRACGVISSRPSSEESADGMCTDHVERGLIFIYI
jgi:hypothetical protein